MPFAEALALPLPAFMTIHNMVAADATKTRGVPSSTAIRADAGRPRARRTARPRPLAKHAEDMALVDRVLDGDADAFETFGDRYFPALYRFVLGKLEGDRELTLEIVQTALVKAIDKLDSYRGKAALLTWLCACGRNEILMHFRRQRTGPREVELEERMDPAPGFATGRPGAEAKLLEREKAARVHATLDALPEHYSRALEWKYVERLPVKEIARRLEVAPKAAESLLTRARQAFRTSYEELHAEA